MKMIRRGTALVLSLAITASMVAGVLFIKAVADAANNWANATLGELSQLYETGVTPDPGIIATVSGDAGGKSYGAYMFASKPGTPKLFFEWCLASDNGYYRSIGERLEYAYYLGGAGCGSNFDAEWRALAAENGDGFMQAQHDFTRARFYDALVERVEGGVSGFAISNYSIALRNVFWSRAVQHGVEGAYNVISRAFDALGGFKNQSESVLINAIYDESGKLTSGAANAMNGSTASKYGVAGKSMAYYTGCSGDIQMGVYIRLRINEPSDAQIMLLSNVSAPVEEGVYSIHNDSNLYMKSSNGALTLVAGNSTAMALTYFSSGYYTLTFHTGEGDGSRLAIVDGKPVLEAPSAASRQMWELRNVSGGYALRNRASDTWLAIAEGGKLVTTDKEAEATSWRLDPTGNGWSISGMFYPSQSNGLVAGSASFPIRGTIRSSTPITNVTVKVEGSSISVSDTPNTTRYSLKTLDSRIPISKLGAGNYTFVVTATNTGGTVELVRSAFTVYQPASATVTFDAQGGTLTSGSASASLRVGDPYGTLPTAERGDGVFVGWFTAPEGGDQVTASSTVPANNHTLYARYGSLYTFTFKGGKDEVLLSSTAAVGSVIPAPGTTPAPYMEGGTYFAFDHWQSGDITFVPGETVMPAEDVTFVPVYVSSAIGGGAEVPPDTYLAGIAPGTAAADFAKALGASVFLSDGVTAVTEGALATGMTAKVNGMLYSIAVTGDVNGDGKISITDVVQLQSCVVGRITLEGPYARAADINNDGKIGITDVVQAAQVTVGKRTIG